MQGDHTTAEYPAVKVCGITNLEDARFVAGAGADFIGFIFYPKSPRYIEPPKAGAIINWIHGPVPVGVFVNHPAEEVNRIARETGVELIQLHGIESPHYCRLMEKPVIKVIHVGEEDDAEGLRERIRPYLELEQVRYLMFDTDAGPLWGGSGRVFDWNLLREISREKPFILSGGLNDANVESAFRSVRPFAIDLSSGLEQAPGLKDYDKVERFFNSLERLRKEGAAGG